MRVDFTVGTDYKTSVGAFRFEICRNNMNSHHFGIFGTVLVCLERLIFIGGYFGGI